MVEIDVLVDSDEGVVKTKKAFVEDSDIPEEYAEARFYPEQELIIFWGNKPAVISTCKGYTVETH